MREGRLNIEEYVVDSWEKARSYIEGVENGTIKTNKWIKLAVKRYLKDIERNDLDHRTDKVENVFKFFSLLNININNRYQQFTLLPFQAFFIVALFAPYWKDTEKRKYRYAFLFMARKNGKTVFSAALQLYFLVGDGQLDPQSLLLASTREQAQIALDYAKAIIENTSVLDKRLEMQRSRIIYKKEKSMGFMKTLASNSSRLDGYKPTAAILDEIHAYPDNTLFGVIKTGILASFNPMVMLISTAGASLDSFCYEMVETSKQILNGEVEDDSFFAMLYMLDENDDEKDYNNWIKANPAIGEVIDIKNLEIEYKQAINIPSLWNDFLTKNLNKFIHSISVWIPDEALKPSIINIDEVELLGRECFIGIDLSSTRDLSSIVALFYDEGRFKVLPYFFRANNPNKVLRKGNVNLDTWVREGYITQCQTATIDYELIFQKINELNEKFNVVGVAYDQFNSALIIPKIQELGVDTYNFPQTAKHFNFPLKYIEKQFFDKTIDIQLNKAMLWNLRNVVVYIDGNGNIKVLKNKSLDAVDGAVSLGMAMGYWMKIYLDDEGASLDAYLKED